MINRADISVDLIDHMGSDLSVVNAARVSFAKQSIELTDGDKKLLRYLAAHKHTSPFNHTFASFRIKAPIFVARQLVKHKFLPWNEVSRRYVDDEPEFYFPDSWRSRPEASIKQGSGAPIENQDSVAFEVKALSAECLKVYQWALNQGVAPEQARMVLPLNTMTEWIWSGTLGAWADMCRLRLDDHAQAESREVALQISQLLGSVFPHAWGALQAVSH